MIRHVVLFKIRKDAPKREIDAVFKALAALKGKVPGIVAFDAGPYESAEGLNRGFTHGFTMDFADAKARDGYLPHPEHEKVKKAIFGLLDGGIDGVIAFDFAVKT